MTVSHQLCPLTDYDHYYIQCSLKQDVYRVPGLMAQLMKWPTGNQVVMASGPSRFFVVYNVFNSCFKWQKLVTCMEQLVLVKKPRNTVWLMWPQRYGWNDVKPTEIQQHCHELDRRTWQMYYFNIDHLISKVARKKGQPNDWILRVELKTYPILSHLC